MVSLVGGSTECMASDAIGRLGIVVRLVLVAGHAFLTTRESYLMCHVTVRATLMSLDGMGTCTHLMAALAGRTLVAMRLVALDAVRMGG